MKEQPTNFNANSANTETKPKRHGRYFWLKVIAGLIILLAILYFVSEELFYNVTSKLIILILAVLSILFIIAPFKYIKKKYGGLTPKRIIWGSLVTIVSTAVVIAVWFGLFYLSFIFFAQVIHQSF